MAIIILDSILRREKNGETKRKDARKIVSIEDYRGVVLLPVRNRPSLISSASWNTGPLTAA